MKKWILVLGLFIVFGNTFAQNHLEKLKLQLNRTTKFNDSKKLVLDHYAEQLKQLKSTDTTLRKQYLRDLKKWNRQFWINEYYTDKNGEIANPLQINLEAVKALSEANQTDRTNSTDATAAQPGFWSQIGPYRVDKGIGRIDDIAFDPNNPNVIYAGSPSGGLFRSTNSGGSWDPISSFLPFLGISGIVVDPTNSSTIYVLTGSGDNTPNSLVTQYGFRGSADGVYKTTDGGGSWFRTGSNFNSELGHELIIDPTNPSVLLAATDSTIYRTNNRGLSWTKTLFVPNQVMFDIAFHPNNSQVVYATSQNAFYRSTNNGITWTAVNVIGLNTANRISIGVTPANPNRVMLFSGPVTLNPFPGIDSFNGFFTSNDAGLSFTRLTQTPNLFGNYIGNMNNSDQSAYDNAIAISPTNENIVYVGGLCVWKSINGGSNWTQVSAYWDSDDPYMHPDVHELKFSPFTGTLFCGNDGGAYSYANPAWSYISAGLSTTQFYQFELYNDEDKMWGGAQDNGIIQESSPGNNNWTLYYTGDGYDVMTDHPWRASDGESDDIYFTVNEKVFKDAFGYTNGKEITPPGNQTKKEFFGNLAMDPVAEDHIYAGYRTALYESVDAGGEWITHAIGADWDVQTNANYVYAAGTGTILRKRIWPNTTWVNITPPATMYSGQKISEINIWQNNPNDIVLALAGVISGEKVIASVDGGVSWFNLSLNLPNVPVFSIARDHQNGFYAGTSIGIFYKKADQNFWTPFSNNLPRVPVTKIYTQYFSIGATTVSQVTCSTFGRGIWRATGYQNDCPADITLTGYHAGPYIWKAANAITSSKNNGGGTGTDVKYSAGNRIVLQNGFRASYGTSFRTYIQPCDAPVGLSSNANTVKISTSADTTHILKAKEIPLLKSNDR